jgi:hypothetical protein
VPESQEPEPLQEFAIDRDKDGRRRLFINGSEHSGDWRLTIKRERDAETEIIFNGKPVRNARVTIDGVWHGSSVRLRVVR